jgi:hypothetical protein
MEARWQCRQCIGLSKDKLDEEIISCHNDCIPIIELRVCECSTYNNFNRHINRNFDKLSNQHTPTDIHAATHCDFDSTFA